MNKRKEVLGNISPARFRHLLIVAVCFWVPVLAFIYLANEVLEPTVSLTDWLLLYGLHTYANPVLDQVILILTQLGGAVLVPAIAALLVVTLYRIHHRRQAIFLLVAVGGAAVISYLLKLIFQRVRPELWPSLSPETTYSFPSGHAMLSAALAFTIMLVLWHTRWRWWAVVIGAVYIVAIGFSRLYLGVHYASDVLAGWCISLAWVYLVYYVLFNRHFWQPQGLKKENPSR